MKKPSDPIKKKVGRPQKLTPEIMDSILTLVEAGNYLKDAVLANDITEKTYYNWLNTGEEDEAAGRNTLHAQLLQSAMCARAKARTYHVGLILKNAEQGRNASASLEYLSRTDPNNWAKERVLMNTPDPMSEPFDMDITKDLLMSLVEEHPEIREELAKKLEAIST